MATLALSALTPISATIPSSERPGLEPGAGGALAEARAPEGVGQLAYWADVVQRGTACDLPGCSIKYDNFLDCMWRTVQRGNMRHSTAAFVADGLKNGFTLGIDVSKMHGYRSFKNYNSALEASASVMKAVQKRVDGGKTLDLGPCTSEMECALRSIYDAFAFFPMGAASKSVESYANEKRATDDHTRTGVNAATDMRGLRYSLNTYCEIAAFLKSGYFMRVSDVDSAYPILPLRSSIWPFMLFRFCSMLLPGGAQHAYAHIFADFGTAGAPGTFKLFFEDTVLAMARSEQIISVPQPVGDPTDTSVYVDDVQHIGAVRATVDAEMDVLHVWSAETCGVFFKAIKDRLAATRQYAIGFWWDSSTLTRELDKLKFEAYMLEFGSALACNSVTLHEMQKLLGRAQRALYTLPAGAACLLTSSYALMSGLTLPWHRRRLTKAVRRDLGALMGLLKLNMGKGYYSYANFVPGITVATDASRSGRFSGGGFVCSDGRYDFWSYGTRAARRLIDFLEGDTVVEAVRRCCAGWRGRSVKFLVDNSSFEKSGEKGRSRAERLNDLLKELLMFQIIYGFVIVFEWISTTRNRLADHVSRDREADFLQDAHGDGSSESQSAWWHLAPDVVPRRLDDSVGRTRQLPERRGVITAEMVRAAHVLPPRTAADVSASGLNVGADVFSMEAVASVVEAMVARDEPCRRGDEEPDVCNEHTGYHVGPIMHTEFTPGHFNFWCVECGADLEAAPAGGCPLAVAGVYCAAVAGGATFVDTTAPAPASDSDPAGTGIDSRQSDFLDEEDGAQSYFARAMRAMGQTVPPAPAAGASTPAAPAPPRQVRAGRRGSLLHVGLLFLAMCSVGESAGVRGQEADAEVAVSCVRSSIFDGLPGEFLDPIERMLDNRLAASSMRKVARASRLWREFADEHEWGSIIRTDDPNRGGKMAAFVMSLVMTTAIVYTSISKTVWALVEWFKLQHQADPRVGLVGWKNFMLSVKVLTFAPAEPHTRCPVEVLERVLLSLDVNCFEDVQLGFLLVLLLFTFHRSESPLAKSAEGLEGFDPGENFCVADFLMERCAATFNRFVAKVRQRRTKVDRLQERPEARGSGDWAEIGDVDDETFSISVWFLRVLQFHQRARGKDEPFFVNPRLHPDGTSDVFEIGPADAWTYRAALDKFHAAQLAVGIAKEDWFGFHGIRVEGYNLSKAGNGVKITVAHGNWKSRAHGRYARYRLDMRKVWAIPSNMLRARGGEAVRLGEETAEGSGGSADESDGLGSHVCWTSDDEDASVAGEQVEATLVVRDAVSPARRLSRGDFAALSALPGPSSGLGSAAPRDALVAACSDSSLVPPGWRPERKTASSGRSYTVYVGPAGERASSRPDAWRRFERRRAEAACSDADDECDGREEERRGSPSPRRQGPTPKRILVRPSAQVVSVDELAAMPVEWTKPSGRRPPAERARAT